MEKQTAINLLGGTPVKAAKAMGYKSVQAIYLWPEILSAAVADRVSGALSRIQLRQAPDCPKSTAPSDVATPKEKFERLADGLELQDRRQAQQPFEGPDRRLPGAYRTAAE